MSRTVHPIHVAMADLAREEVRGAEHTAPNRLVAYLRGELPASEAAAVVDHLSLCPECAALLLEAVRFLEDDEEEEEEDEAKETEEAWRALQAARRGQESPAPVAVEAQPAPIPVPVPLLAAKRPILRRLSTAYGLAALLAIVCAGLALYPHREGSSTPVVNEGFYDLVPSDSERGAPGTEILVHFSTPESSAHLVLNPRGALTYEAYSVSVLGSDGKTIWSHDELTEEGGVFHLTLKARSFPPGSYRIELYGWNYDRIAELGRYRIKIAG